MGNKLIWTIGRPGSDLREFKDNFRDSNAITDNVWTINAEGTLDGGRPWPLFHSSDADPDGGYRLHPYTVHFELGGVPGADYLLQLHYIVTTPRIPYVELSVNGACGNGYLRPKPSDSGIMKPKHSLHTTIYSQGTIDFIIPGHLLKQGKNSVTITARDDQQVTIVTNPQAILRMDRMANAAGFYYDYVQLFELEKEATGKLADASITPTVMYRRAGDGLVEKCYLYVELGAGVQTGVVKLSLSSDQGMEERVWPIETAIPFGQLMFSFDVKDGEGPVEYVLDMELDGQSHSRQGSFKRRRKWKVYTTPHAHTDIGYTHRQWEVAERLCINIDKALDILDEEKESTERTGRPPFTYVLDSSWALEQFLETRDEATKRRLYEAIKAGHIGIPSNYVDLLTQFASLEDLIRNGEFSDSVFREMGMQADSAAIVDVASATGSLPAIMEGMGVKYLIHANNQDRGPFRLNGGLHKISPFYWESEHGGAILVWLAKMYCELKKVCGSPASPEAAELGLQMWLDEYETDAYAPDAVILYGQDADNTDIDPSPVQFVKEWNDMYEYPQLIPCNGSEFFEYVEANFKSELKVVKGDQGAYWEDGVGSSIVPTMDVRKAQTMLPAAETLESLAVIHHDGWTFPERQYEEAWRQVLLYDEHTWGSFMAGTDPKAVLQQDQWDVKEHMADASLKWAERLLLGAMTRHSLSWNNNGREVVVYNPHSWAFSGTVRVEIALGESVHDADTGEAVDLRVLSSSLTQSWVELWIEELPGLSYRRYELKPASRTADAVTENAGDDAIITAENGYYAITIDAARGCLASCFDKELERELIDSADLYGCGQFLYARGGEGTKLLGNHADKTDDGAELIAEYKLLEATKETFSYGTSIKLRAIVPLGELETEWILYDKEKKVGVTYRYNKEETLATEAVYISFPFQLTAAEVLSDSQLGWVNWDKDQLPGACKEWLPLQSGILVSGKEADVLIASPDIPLFTSQQEVKGRWPKELKLSGSKVYSFVLNNYWKSNYKPSQGGEIVFRYAITSGAGIPRENAYRFGRQERQRISAQRMSYQEFRQERAPYVSRSGAVLATIGSDKIVLSTMKKAKYDEGFIVRLQEISGTDQRSSVAFTGRRIARAWTTDLLEHDRKEIPVLPEGSLAIEVPAGQLVTLRIVLE